MKKIGLLLWVLLACESPQARKPLNAEKSSFIQSSIDRNKKINAAQEQRIKSVIAQDSSRVYQNNPSGFWYAFLKKTDKRTLPVRGDEVKFSYKIATLEGEILYDEMELGEVNYLVDKEDLIAALRLGVKVLSEGEVATFLFPSHLCYGYQGDGDKIGINQPLRYTLQLNYHKKQNQK